MISFEPIVFELNANLIFWVVFYLLLILWFILPLLFDLRTNGKKPEDENKVFIFAFKVLLSFPLALFTVFLALTVYLVNELLVQAIKLLTFLKGKIWS